MFICRLWEVNNLITCGFSVDETINFLKPVKLCQPTQQRSFFTNVMNKAPYILSFQLATSVTILYLRSIEVEFLYCALCCLNALT